MHKAVLAMLLFLALLLLAYQSLIAWDVRGVRAFQYSYGRFLKDAAAAGCLQKEAIVNSAKKRGWKIEENVQLPFRSGAPEEFSVAVRVFVEPPLNFSKEPGVKFFFDEAGCLIS